MYIFFKRTSKNFQNSLIKSLILPIKHYKKFNKFLQVSIGEIGKKDVKNAKRINKTK